MPAVSFVQSKDMPKDLQAERAVLGCVLQKHILLADIERSIPTVAYFADPSHRTLYEHFRALRDAGQPINVVTAGGYLGPERRAEAAKYLAYCVRTAELDVWEAYVGMVCNTYRCRTLVEQAQRLAQLAVDGHLTESYAAIESFGATKFYPNGRLYTYADLEERHTQWMWPGFIANGLAHLLFSFKGDGKTSVLLKMCASIIHGCPWPDGTPYVGERGKILFADAENFQFVNKERMLAQGLPLDSFICPMAPDQDFSFENQTHINAMAYIAAKPEVKLIVVDGLQAAQQNQRENDAQAGKNVAVLAGLAKQFNKPFILSHHANKLGNENRRVQHGLLSREDFRGSSSIIAQTRVVIACSWPDPGSEKRVLHVVATNFKPPPPLTYSITGQGAVFDGAEAPDLRQLTSVDMAADALIKLLKHGAMPSHEVKAQTEAMGITWTAVTKAKSKLNILAVPSVLNKRVYMWSFAARHLSETSEEADSP